MLFLLISIVVISLPSSGCVLLLQTGVWTELYKIEDTFLKPLRVGVNMSRAHYERELHNTMQTKKGKIKGQTSTRLFALILVSMSVPLPQSTRILFADVKQNWE